MGKMSDKHISFMNLLMAISREENAWCIWCGYEPLEPDYDKCPECNRSNPIRRAGMI